MANVTNAAQELEQLEIDLELAIAAGDKHEIERIERAINRLDAEVYA